MIDFSKVTAWKTCDLCKKKTTEAHRHHLRREKLFVQIFGHTPKYKTKWWERLAARYEEFRPSDVRVLCPDCHRDIHHVYALRLREWNRMMMGKSIEDYTIKEAQALMAEFRRVYFEYRRSLSKPKRRRR